VKRLHHSCPAVLHSVIPILETELRADGTTPRIIATQTLGEMYADKGGPDLVRKYPSTWQAWINRRADIAVPVRLKCVEAIPALLSNLPECKETLEGRANLCTSLVKLELINYVDFLKTKILDPDEKVRAATCKVYSQLDYETALHHVSESQLRAVAGRGLDKKVWTRLSFIHFVKGVVNTADCAYRGPQ
jgi:sister-chromatid-cohesion protein PDS5